MIKMFVTNKLKLTAEAGFGNAFCDEYVIVELKDKNYMEPLLF